MANPYTTLRAAIASDLAGQFPAADVLSGDREGKSADKPRIAVAWTGTSELLPDVVVATVGLAVRYWPATPKVRDLAVSGVRDPGELEQAAFDLQDYLQTRQTSYSSSVWYLRLIGVVPNYDPEEWYVEATLTAQLSNPGVL